MNDAASSVWTNLGGGVCWELGMAGGAFGGVLAGGLEFLESLGILLLSWEERDWRSWLGFLLVLFRCG